MSQAIQQTCADQVRHIPICIYPPQTDPFRLFISHFFCALFSDQMYLQLKTMFAFNVPNSKKMYISLPVQPLLLVTSRNAMCTTTELIIIKIHGLPSNFQMLETFEHANMNHNRINYTSYNGLICGRNVFLTMDQSTGTNT
jgi:hypothetical protein